MPENVQVNHNLALTIVYVIYNLILEPLLLMHLPLGCDSKLHTQFGHSPNSNRAKALPIPFSISHFPFTHFPSHVNDQDYGAMNALPGNW